MTSPRGIVFGATGASYVALARRAARTVRRVMPDTPIDLFTDAPLADAVFDQVHILDQTTTRPKMAALRRSRFDRTIWLDCDVIVLADLAEVFDLLGRVDIAGAHEHYGSSPVAMMQTGPDDIPPAFRQINSGVLGVRSGPATHDFLDRWASEFARRGLRYDQPLLRELLWDSDLRLGVLPHEYNLMHMPYLMAGNDRMMAPRVLHLPHLHVYDKFIADPSSPLTAGEILSPDELMELERRMASDRTLGARRAARDVLADLLRHAPALERPVRRLWHRWRR